MPARGWDTPSLTGPPNFTETETAFVDQGGVTITGRCSGGGSVVLEAAATANNGLPRLTAVNADNSRHSGTILNFDVPDAIIFDGGSEVSGEVVIAQRAAAAQCVIAGTLFVG